MDTETDTHTRPLVIVDAANTVGSVPDGWWRDRRGATERLRDALAPLAERGLPPAPGVPDWATTPPLELVLVVEGAARGVDSVPGVRVVAAPGSGDDLIADLAAAADRPCLVITADRELRRRVAAHGAAVVGPKVVRP
ncbi:NTP pyrophosphohydrolase [Actinacidiphila soli]|uniref:NTP pyrophosphohydrolase n=1 Tax=Actinacidiphila soli TaxID=2487275 RepID=UPI000FCAC08B|nr:NTP pyrophosphohydrolase [Actinacidiphila soli]